MGAATFGWNTFVPFRLPLSTLCGRCKVEVAARVGPGLGDDAVEQGAGWMWAGSQRPVPAVSGGAQGAPHADEGETGGS